MRNIWEIFKGDLVRTTRSVVGIVVLVGMIIVPALYAWLNIAGGWDPYNNTEGLKVAVANEDAGYEGDLVPLSVNFGNDVVSALRANDQFDWVFTDEADAVEGVKSGEYYASIVVPESFSADMMTLFSTDIKHSDIVYYSNEKENAIAPRVTGKGASAIQSLIDQEFTQTVDEVGLKLVSQLVAYLDSGSVGNYVTALDRTLDTITVDLDNASVQASSFSQLIGSTSKLVASTAHIMADSGASTAETKSMISDARSGLAGVEGALDRSIALVNDALSQSTASFDAIERGVDQAFDALQGQSSAVADGLAAASGDVQSMIDSYAAIRDAVAAADPESPTIAQIDQALALLQSLKSGIDAASADIATASSDASAQRAAIKDLIGQAKQSIEGVNAGYAQDLAAKTDELKRSLSSVDLSASGVLAGLNATLSGLSSSGSSLVGDLESAQSALDEAARTLAGASDKLRDSRVDLEEALAHGDMDKIRSIIGSDAGSMASFLASPVSVERQSVYGIENYGSSMASFYTILSIWVGSIILAALMKVEVSKRRVEELGGTVKLYQLYFGRFGIFALLALLQSTIVCLGDILFLGIQCVHPFLFIVAGWAASLVFCSIIYTLTVSFGDIGKAIAVVLLVMQVAGSGGTFPIEMTAGFFQAIYPFLPFTHGIAAMHACVGGIYGNEFWIDIARLLLFLVPTLLLGLVLRRPVIKLNAFIIHKLEETKLM